MNCLREQCNGLITVDGTKKALPILEAWMNSSAVFWVNTSFPVNGLSLKVGKPDKSGWIVEIPMYYHPVRGLWRAYVPGFYFQRHGETAYKLVAVDEYDRRTVAGEGLLRVFGGRIYDIEDDPGLSPEIHCFAKFPDGTWRKVTVAEDAVGEPVFRVGDTAIDPRAFEKAPGDLYAYNKAQGRFYAVTGKIDSAGAPTLAVADTPSEAGAEAFALDETTRFYYRVEADTDIVGETIIKVGEKQQ